MLLGRLLSKNMDCRSFSGYEPLSRECGVWCGVVWGVLGGALHVRGSCLEAAWRSSTRCRPAYAFPAFAFAGFNCCVCVCVHGEAARPLFSSPRPSRDLCMLRVRLPGARRPVACDGGAWRRGAPLPCGQRSRSAAGGRWQEQEGWPREEERGGG
eukprot:269784-Chlamydomonas_euryale.AAC.1